MKITIVLLVSVPLLYIIGSYLRLSFYAQKSTPLIEVAQAYPKYYEIGNPKNPAVSLVVLGDSTTIGVGTTSATEAYPHQIAEHIVGQGKYIKVTILGSSGARMRTVVEEQLTKLNTIHADIIIISVGANDATHMTSVSDYRTDLTKVISSLTQSSSQIYFGNTPDMGTTPALPLPYAMLAGKQAREQNNILISLTNGTNIKIIDLYTKAKLIYRDNPELYAADLFHPSVQGYHQWRDAFTESLDNHQK